MLQAMHHITSCVEHVLDWSTLVAFNELKQPVSFNAIYKVFHRGNAGYSNFRHYAVINRLAAQGYIRQEYNKRGWRLWSITPEGRQAIAQLNEAARKYLPD